jgi:hypothetical protein
MGKSILKRRVGSLLKRFSATLVASSRIGLDVLSLDPQRSPTLLVPVKSEGDAENARHGLASFVLGDA